MADIERSGFEHRAGETRPRAMGEPAVPAPGLAVPDQVARAPGPPIAAGDGDGDGDGGGGMVASDAHLAGETTRRVRLRRLPVAVTCVVLGTALSSSCARSSDDLSCTSEDGIGVRNGHAAAFDASTGGMVVFGGADHCRVRGDTWSWSGGAWHLVARDGPSPRTFPTMTYDAARREIVLFGGNTVLFGSADHPGRMLGDTWVLSGGRWIRRSPEPSPPPRAEASMAWDARRNRVVLFGGRVLVGDSVRRLGDTWEWDGARWELRSNEGPPPRSGAAAAYDPGSRRVLLFGGSGARNDTWSWDGDAWREVGTREPPGVFDAEMASYPPIGGVVRFGGWTGEHRTADTWIWNGAWSLRSTTGPEARNHATLVFDSDRTRLLLFGGHDGTRVFGDLWQFDDAGWTLVAARDARVRVPNGH